MPKNRYSQHRIGTPASIGITHFSDRDGSTATWREDLKKDAAKLRFPRAHGGRVCIEGSRVYSGTSHLNMAAEPKVLISREQISQRVAEMGAQITRDFGGQSVILVGVLKGAAIFLSDLARHIDLDATFDFIGVSSYGNRPSPVQEAKGGWDSTGEVRLTKDVDQSMRDKNVILVEDILDTGLTLNYLRNIMQGHQPRTLRIAALLDKPSRRKKPIQADYLGFTIPDEFVVGYGLDYAERYRNLPDICVMPKES